MRYEDARFEAIIRDEIERNVLGVVEPDQPTETSHFLWGERRARLLFGEFTRDERAQIRLALGLYDDDEGGREST